MLAALALLFCGALFAGFLCPAPDASSANIPSIEPAFSPTLFAEEEVDKELADPASHLADETPPASSDMANWGPTEPFSWLEIDIRKGDNLQTAMVENGIGLQAARQLVGAIAKVYNVRRVMPGHSIGIKLFGNGSVVEAVYRPGSLEEIRIHRKGNDLLASHITIEPEIEIVGSEVTVNGSLYLSFQKQHLPVSLLYETARLFGWSIDFSHDVRPGDKLQLLWEQLRLKGQPFRIGRILAARYIGKTTHSAFYWYPENEADRWFHPDGRDVAADFIRSPVHFSRISSRFSRRRLHPVLGISRPHSGVDFAAPRGTPVMAAADGIVLSTGRMGGAGLAIRIKHRNGWVTSYSHLSKIMVRRKQTVRQKQIIGKVGSTGLATGPHLDYRIKIRNRFVDPLKVQLPQGRKIASTRMPAFEQKVDQLNKQLVEALEAARVDIATAAKYTKEP